MGEWSEYFKQFPEENPANRNQGSNLGSMSIAFPHLHLSQLTKEELEAENAKILELNAELERVEQKTVNLIKEAKLKQPIRLDDCPICCLNTMHVYKALEDSYYCECEYCNISGIGLNVNDIYKEIEDRVWTNDN